MSNTSRHIIHYFGRDFTAVLSCDYRRKRLVFSPELSVSFFSDSVKGRGLEIHSASAATRVPEMQRHCFEDVHDDIEFQQFLVSRKSRDRFASRSQSDLQAVHRME